MNKEFQRARRPEQKAQRSEAILEAAAKLLDAQGIDNMTLAGIAAEAGVVKSNLYRYFESREEILIRVLMLESRALIAELGTLYAGLTKNDLKAMAAVFAATCAARPRFCLLISRMAPTLENNISIPAIIEIKRELLPMLAGMAETVAEAAPDLGPEGAFDAVNMLTTTVAGLWPMAVPSAPVAEALQEPDLAAFRSDFQVELARTGHAILEGVRIQNQAEP